MPRHADSGTAIQAKKRLSQGRPANRNHLIASAAATLEVLEVIANEGKPTTLTDVATLTGKPKGTVHRMLATLVNTGFLVQDPESSQYLLTLKLWRLGASTVGRLDMVKVARPWLERLAAATDETVHMSSLDVSGGIVYISKVESPRSISVQTRIGQLSPAWCTATGRSILAFNALAAERVLAGALEPRTQRTVTDPKRIRAALREVAAEGYAVTRGENHPDVGGIAAPVRDHAGTVIAAIGIGVPAFRMDRALVARCVPHVVHAAAGISSELGYRLQGAAAFQAPVSN